MALAPHDILRFIRGDGTPNLRTQILTELGDPESLTSRWLSEIEEWAKRALPPSVADDDSLSPREEQARVFSGQSRRSPSRARLQRKSTESLDIAATVACAFTPSLMPEFLQAAIRVAIEARQKAIGALLRDYLDYQKGTASLEATERIRLALADPSSALCDVLEKVSLLSGQTAIISGDVSRVADDARDNLTKTSRDNCTQECIENYPDK